MQKLASSPTQTQLISYRRAKEPPTLSDSSPRISRVKSDDDRCTSQQIPIWGAKPALNSISIHPKWRNWANLGNVLLGDDDVHSSHDISISGEKRARNSISTHPNWRDWTDLGDGPAGLIAERLLANDIADYVCFRAVCRPWRLCSMDPRAHGILDRRFHPIHWIMLRETGDSPRCRFMNVSTGYTRYVDLPELSGHDVFGPTTEGLLVLLDRITWVVRLLNPFTRQVADLPPATTLMTESDLKRTSVRRDLLQVSGAGLADDCTMAIHFRMIKTIAIVKPGDSHWIVVDRGTLFLPALSFAGRFYCATTNAVMVVDTSADQPPRLVIVANLTRPLSRMMMDTVHLVENDGELILVDRRHNGNDNRKYELYWVDLHSRKMVLIRGLSGRAVFIGIELALSVSPSVFPSISADAIYLGFDRQMRGRLDNSPIHLLDGTAEHRQFGNSIDGMPLYEPLGLDDYLSWCVTGYRNTLKDTD